MNFFRKLFGAKPTAPASPNPQTPKPEAPPSSPLPVSSVPPRATPATPAPVPPAPKSANSAPGGDASSSATGSNSASFRFQASPPPVQIETTLLAVPSPLWLPADSPAIELVPVKPDDAPAIAFLGGSADFGSSDSPHRTQFAEAAGRLSRAIPLYLAEQVELGTLAVTRTLISWVVKPAPGFIVGGQNWDDATAARHARQSVPDDPADYLVMTHLVCHRDPWTIELRLIRTIDAACLATVSVTCAAGDPSQALTPLTRDLLAQLAAHADLPALVPASESSEASLIATPSAAYLFRLEQLLAVLTAGMGQAAGRLIGERDILEGQRQLCLEQSGSVPVRLLFAHTLRAMKRVRPQLLPEFRSSVDLLQKTHPLPEPAQSVIAHVLADVFAS